MCRQNDDPGEAIPARDREEQPHWEQGDGGRLRAGRDGRCLLHAHSGLSSGPAFLHTTYNLIFCAQFVRMKIPC